MDFLVDLQGEAMSNQCLIYVGALCACINIPLLFVFLTSRQFRGRFQVVLNLLTYWWTLSYKLSIPYRFYSKTIQSHINTNSWLKLGKLQLLITLAIADFVNCLSIMAQGLQRVSSFWLFLRFCGLSINCSPSVPVNHTNALDDCKITFIVDTTLHMPFMLLHLFIYFFHLFIKVCPHQTILQS